MSTRKFKTTKNTLNHQSDNYSLKQVYTTFLRKVTTVDLADQAFLSRKCHFKYKCMVTRLSWCSQNAVVIVYIKF